MPQAKYSQATSSDSRTEAKPKRAYRTAEQWREIVDAYQRSDLTRAEFCKQYGVAISGLYNWQRRFEQELAPQPMHEETFVEVHPPTPPIETPSQSWDVELELGHGRVLRVRIA